jgi:succinyl-CoA synthetase beta subunit
MNTRPKEVFAVKYGIPGSRRRRGIHYRGSPKVPPIPWDGYPVVVKAQIHAGGRGKGGGVKLAQSAAEERI